MGTSARPTQGEHYKKTGITLTRQKKKRCKHTGLKQIKSKGKNNQQDEQSETSKSPRLLKEVRQNLVNSAKVFLNNPYVGSENHFIKEKCKEKGKGKKKRKQRRGHHIDCSELVQRAYAANKLGVPRTACMQFERCNKIKDHVEERLKPGDLIFTAHARRPHRIDHVMMYMGNGILIESTGAHGKVRIIPIKRRSGKFLSELPYGKRSGKFVYFFGSFFKKKIQLS